MAQQRHRQRGALDSRLDAPLEGRTGVVTGASRGIGRAIALELGRAGANVVVNYHSSEAAAGHVADAIDRGVGAAVTARADVGDAASVESLERVARSTFGSVDILVNNAGITADQRFDRMTDDDWYRVIDVNLNGTFRCTKAFYEDIKASEHGRLINVASVIGQTGNYGQANYAASKSALFGFTRSLARELAPHRSTANCIAPGYTATDMVEGVRDDIKDRIRDDIPLGRFATAEEIAGAVRYLASDEAAFVTGETINVNGGMYV